MSERPSHRTQLHGVHCGSKTTVFHDVSKQGISRRDKICQLMTFTILQTIMVGTIANYMFLPSFFYTYDTISSYLDLPLARRTSLRQELRPSPRRRSTVAAAQHYAGSGSVPRWSVAVLCWQRAVPLAVAVPLARRCTIGLSCTVGLRCTVDRRCAVGPSLYRWPSLYLWPVAAPCGQLSGIG